MSDDFIHFSHKVSLESPLGAKHLSHSIGKPYSSLLQEINPHDRGAEIFIHSIKHAKHNRDLYHSHSPFKALVEYKD